MSVGRKTFFCLCCAIVTRFPLFLWFNFHSSIIVDKFFVARIPMRFQLVNRDNQHWRQQASFSLAVKSCQWSFRFEPATRDVNDLESNHEVLSSYCTHVTNENHVDCVYVTGNYGCWLFFSASFQPTIVTEAKIFCYVYRIQNISLWTVLKHTQFIIFRNTKLYL